MATSLRHNGQIPTDPIITLLFAVTAFTWLSMQMTQEQAAACSPLFTGIIAELISRLFPSAGR